MVGGVPEDVSCFDYVAVCGEEVVAWVDVLGFLPRLVGDVPELVILSRGDRAIANLELDECVFVRPNRCHFTSTRLTRLRIVSKHNVANSYVGGSDGGAVC